MEMSEKRKVELNSKYGDNSLSPIPTDYLNKAKFESARYILFVNKDNKHGYCEHCGKTVEFDKTKHKEEVVCPNCKGKMTVQHTWRKPKCEWHLDWFVYGQAVDNETIVLRYIGVNQNEDYTKTVKELAREVFDYKHGWSYKYSFVDNTWKIKSSYYFTEFIMGYHRRKQCCIGATEINNVKAEVAKLDCMKYFKHLNRYYRVYVYPRDNVKCLMNVSLYEKLENAGLGKLAMSDYTRYYKAIKYKRTETSLIKMLGIDKLRFNLLRKYSNVTSLDFIREHKDMPIDMLQYILSNNAISTYQMMNNNLNTNTFKALKYIVSNKINTWEYSHYFDMLNKLGYQLDNSYLYPKDFRKADSRVTDEYLAKQNEIKLKHMTKQSAIIKKISDGLRGMENLREFLDGSKGLLVYVPESAKDLLDEGRSLHNCIGTYVDRVAEGKTFVFFVRKLDAPNEPFVAFEYANGGVVQCRYDHNKAVKDDNIINFVDAFAERLRKNKVLYFDSFDIKVA